MAQSSSDFGNLGNPNSSLFTRISHWFAKAGNPQPAMPTDPTDPAAPNSAEPTTAPIELKNTVRKLQVRDLISARHYV